MASSRSKNLLSIAFIGSIGLSAISCGRTESASPPPPSSKPAAAPASPSPASQEKALAKETFGKSPCGRLVTIEEVEAVFGREVPMIDVVAEGNCVYEGKSGAPLLDVKLASGPGLRCTEKDGTYLGKAAEPVELAGAQAIWSEAAGTLCLVKGDDRVQVSLGAPPASGRDRKGAATELARKAAGRLPLDKRP